jgi:acyl-CoA thioesterase-2
VDGPSAPVESLWRLEPVGPRLFHGWCRDGALQRVFGGQVAAQALAAAGAELASDWCPQSLHAYFVREGRSAQPVEYRVEPVEAEDPAVRLFRVTASQGDRPILILDTSYGRMGDGAWPLPARPESDDDLVGWTAVEEEARWLADRARKARFDFRFVDPPSALTGRRGEISLGQRFWLRTSAPLPDEGRHHTCALTYASDLFLVSTALARHGLPGGRSGIQAATIDHAIWFHRPVRADDWLSYEQTSPSSAGARGLSAGRIVDRTGQLAATVRQEVLLRVTVPSPPDPR